MDRQRRKSLRRRTNTRSIFSKCRLLSLGEWLEPRLALSGNPVIGYIPSDMTHPFPDGLSHADLLARSAIAAITTTASDDQFLLLEDFEADSAPPGLALVEAAELIDLPAFRSDLRYAGIDGSGFSVVILDSGIDLDHPFFGPDENADGVADRIVFNADFVSGGSNANDVHGHGTHVSSIIASQD